MCKFAFLRQIFGDFYLYREKKFLTKGGSKNKISFAKGGSIECRAGGGIRTLPFRRGVTVPFPPPCPRVIAKCQKRHFATTFLGNRDFNLDYVPEQGTKSCKILMV